MANIGKDLARELMRLYQRPSITFERGIMQTNDNSTLGFIEDADNFERDIDGTMRRRNGSIVLNKRPFEEDHENKWHFIKHFPVCGADLLLGLNYKREMWGWLTDWPEIDFRICGCGISPMFAEYTTGSYAEPTYHMTFSRGSRYWAIDDEQFIYVINDFGDSWRINKRGYFKISDFRSETSRSLSRDIEACRDGTCIDYAIWLDIKNATNKLPDDFYIVEDRFERSIPVSGLVRVAYRNECGTISKFSEPVELVDYKSVFVSRYPAVTTKVLANDDKNDCLNIDAGFKKLTYDSADTDAVPSNNQTIFCIQRKFNTTDFVFEYEVWNNDAAGPTFTNTDYATVPCSILYVQKKIEAGDHTNVDFDPYLIAGLEEDSFYLVVDDVTVPALFSSPIDDTSEQYGNFIRLENVKYMDVFPWAKSDSFSLTDEFFTRGDMDTFILQRTPFSGFLGRIGHADDTTGDIGLEFHTGTLTLYPGETNEQAVNYTTIDGHYRSDGSPVYYYKLKHLGIRPTFPTLMQLQGRLGGKAEKYALFYGNLLSCDVRMEYSGGKYLLANNCYVYKRGFWFDDDCIAMEHNFYNTWKIHSVGTGNNLPKIENNLAFQINPRTKMVEWTVPGVVGIDIQLLVSRRGNYGDTDEPTNTFMRDGDRFVVWNDDMIKAESQRGWWFNDPALTLENKLDFVYDYSRTILGVTQSNTPTRNLRKMVAPATSLEYSSAFSYPYQISEIREPIVSPQHIEFNNNSVFVVQGNALYLGGKDLMLTNFTMLPHSVVSMHKLYDGVVLLTDSGFYRVNSKLEMSLIPDTSNAVVKASCSGNGGAYAIDENNRVLFVHMVYTQSGSAIATVDVVSQPVYALSFGNKPKMHFANDTLYIATDYEIWGVVGGVWTKKYSFDDENIDGISSLNGELVVWFNKGTTKSNWLPKPVGSLLS